MLCFVTFGWQFTWFILFNFPSLAGFLVKLGYSSIIFIPIFYYHFNASMLASAKRSKSIAISYLIGFIFLALLWFTPWFINGYYAFFWGPYPKASFLHLAYLGFLGFLAGKIVFDILTQMKTTSRTDPQFTKLKYLLISLIVYTFASVDFLVNYGVEFYPFGVLFILTSILILLYAVAAHNLMEAPLILKNSLITIFLLTLWVVPMILLESFAEKFLRGFYIRVFFFSLMIVVFSQLIGRLKFRAELTLEHFLNKKRYEYRYAVQQISDGIVTIYDLDRLMGYLAETFSNTLEMKRVALVLANQAEYSLSASKGLSPQDESSFKLDAKNAMIAFLKENKIPQFVELMDTEVEFRKFLKKINMQIALPFVFKENLLGVCFLGGRDFEYHYKEEDIDILRALANQIAVAIQTALSFKEIQDLNTSLDQKVRKRTEELQNTLKELNESYQKLQELDRAKMEFFANVSHELRTPLTLILAPMESIIKGKVGVSETAQKGLLEIMYHNALRLLKLINNLLDLAKLDAGRMELYLAKVDLNQFIKGIVASIEPMAEKKEIQLSCPLAGSLPETFVDRDKIEKVILNLVFNSLKFTEPGGKVEINCIQEDHQFKFCIEDTGIGIPQNYLPRIFERFSQADTSATRKYEGTGIGMALAKEFVELHQGKIWVESEVGKGTKVFFTLPYLTQVSELEAKPDKRTRPIVEVEQKKRELDWTRELHQQALYHGEERAPLSAAEPDPQMRLSGRTLLIVEDNLDMLNFISFQLEDQYRLIKAQNGVEGIEAAKKNVPDLIISDVMMPLKDGYQLCREIKSDPRTKHIPVILLTAKADLTMKIEGLEQGADEYLTKPFSSDELRARIQTLLNSRDLERQLQIRNDDLLKALKELKEAQMQLVQSAKMASVGQLAAGIAHEMNNPLTYVSSSIFALERQFQKIREGQTEASNFLEHSQPLLERIGLGVKRTKVIIDDLMNFARKDIHALKDEDINEGIRSVLTLLESRFSDKIKLHLELGDIPKVECVLGQINQVVMNLLLNALDAVSGKGEIWIGTASQDGHVNIKIKDNGKGIPEEAQSRIFEPFFTTKDVGKGTGLGLSISHKIIDNHHGRIDFRSEAGRETEFQIRLPIRQFAVEGAAR